MHSIVVTGGDPPPSWVRDHLKSPSLIIAADSGYAHAQALGLTVDLLIGDLDSISTASMQHAQANAVQVVTYPAEKEATDLALALEAARDRGATSATIVSGGAGRLDHLIGGLLLLPLATIRVDAYIGNAYVAALRSGDCVELRGDPGDYVSLFAIAGSAHGVATNGLRYPLNRESLEPCSSRGISNEFAATRATVELGVGRLLIIQPEGHRQ